MLDNMDNDTMRKAVEMIGDKAQTECSGNVTKERLKEIAEIEYRNGALESRNIETVKSRLFLARQQLQQLLTRDGKRRTTDETD